MLSATVTPPGEVTVGSKRQRANAALAAKRGPNTTAAPVASKRERVLAEAKAVRSENEVSKFGERTRARRAPRGFDAVARSIAARQGIPLERAKAILAARTRAASPAAKRRNPRLKRVRGKRG